MTVRPHVAFVVVAPMKNLVVLRMRPESAYLVVRRDEHVVSQATQDLNAHLMMRCALGIARRDVCQTFQRSVMHLNVSVLVCLSALQMTSSADGSVTQE